MPAEYIWATLCSGEVELMQLFRNYFHTSHLKRINLCEARLYVPFVAVEKGAPAAKYLMIYSITMK